MEIVDNCCSLQGGGGFLWGYRRSGWSSRTRGTSLSGLLAPYSSLSNSRTLPQLLWLFLTLGSHTPCVSVLITWGRHKDQRYLLHFSFAPLAPRELLTWLLYSAFPVWSMAWGISHLRENISFPWDLNSLFSSLNLTAQCSTWNTAVMEMWGCGVMEQTSWEAFGVLF